ncbi:hypothetical protein PHLGIDRAFT_305991 [Phlebiopsis gigantea 11061_1 CR5-6]|uniref:Uncharacterized protein n=1 Tax=Phlebiopsis gigantea (strain 11061_1 CR5-6) TaxID=745531 RepID=A0A0C3S020_PHLG1|nr:hypothetical protein PHLGIDRAFT_305991 [Phlebiopsis gigantea 11061_1 CR5-6]
MMAGPPLVPSPLPSRGYTMDVIRRLLPSIPLLRHIIPQVDEKHPISVLNFPSKVTPASDPSEISNAEYRLFFGNLNIIWDILRKGTPRVNEFWEQRADLAPESLGSLCIREPIELMSCGCYVWSELMTSGSFDIGLGGHRVPVINEDVLTRTERIYHDDVLGEVRQLTLDMMTSPKCKCAATRQQIIHLVFADPTSPPSGNLTRIVYVRAEVVRVRDPAFFKELVEYDEDHDRPLENVLLKEINTRLDHFTSVLDEYREIIRVHLIDQQ